jgi:hypothetical protein
LLPFVMVMPSFLISSWICSHDQTFQCRLPIYWNSIPMNSSLVLVPDISHTES